jgi:hypothetical protein|nr:MAG TPA: hypothetical protein [Caudoviricetes sp.]
MKIFKAKHIISIVLIMAVIVQLTIYFGKLLDLKDSITVFTSSIVTAAGWYWAAHLNHRTFERSEFIKNKDKLTNLVDSCFDKLDELFSKRETTPEDIEIFITEKTTEIENKASQLSRVFKSEIIFLTTDTLTKMKSYPLDLFENNNMFREKKSKLQKFRTDVLEEIDQNYEEWLKKL